MSRGHMSRGQILANGAPPEAGERFGALLDDLGLTEDDVAPGAEAVSVKARSSVSERVDCIAGVLHVLPGAVKRTALEAGLHQMESLMAGTDP